MTRTILVVEDDDSIRELLAEIFTDEGYQVQQVTNGREALHYLLGAHPPCLIISDLMMPDMDGWQFRQAIRQIVTLADIPVVVVSAFPNVRYEGAYLGAVAAFPKPLDIEKLITFVSSHCPPQS